MERISRYGGTVVLDSLIRPGSSNVGDASGDELTWVTVFRCSFWIDQDKSPILRDELLQTTRTLVDGDIPDLPIKWFTGELKSTQNKIVDGVTIEPWVPDVDELIEDGIEVYVRSWDSGAPGAGAGDDRIVYFDGAYWVWLDDSDPEGPYQSFYSAVVDHELFRVSAATTSIDTEHVDIRLLKKMLEPLGPIRFNIELNGERVSGE